MMSAQEATRAAPEQVARGNRVEAVAVLVIATAVLVTARLLTPNPEGCGTHEQLLVIPCAFRWLTGLPCPFCGMTTAFALMARGEVLAALSAHVLGPLLYAATWLLAANAVVALMRGTPALPGWLSGARGARWTLIVIAVGWVINIVLRLLGV